MHRERKNVSPKRCAIKKRRGTHLNPPTYLDWRNGNRKDGQNEVEENMQRSYNMSHHWCYGLLHSAPTFPLKRSSVLSRALHLLWSTGCCCSESLICTAAVSAWSNVWHSKNDQHKMGICFFFLFFKKELRTTKVEFSFKSVVSFFVLGICHRQQLNALNHLPPSSSHIQRI